MKLNFKSKNGVTFGEVILALFIITSIITGVILSLKVNYERLKREAKTIQK
jgi:heme/copper-type cytochrome/quinol oxidase subunit 4